MERTLLTASLVVVLGGCGDETDSLSPGLNDGGHLVDWGHPSNDGSMSANDGGPAEVDGGAIDGGNSACVWTGANAGRPDLERGRISGDGCNECSCVESGIACTQIGCREQRRCTTHAECGVASFCHFDPGCVETMGYCMVGQSRCSVDSNPVAPSGQTSNVICGCDGTTYEALKCFGVRWRDYGSC